MTLIYIPSPLTNESAASLLLRASYNNGYKSLSSFLNAYGFPVHTKSLDSMLNDQQKFGKIIHKLGIVESSVEMIPAIYGPTKSSPRIWYGKPISYQFFCADGTKLCPECIKDSEILKKDWLLKHLTCCTYHKIKLISQCGYCHHPISSNRKRINECYKCRKVFCSPSLEKPTDAEILSNIWFSENLISDDLALIKSIKVFLSVLHSTIHTFKGMVINHSLITLTYLFFNNKSELDRIIFMIIHTNKNLGHPRLLLIHLLSSLDFNIKNFVYNFFKKHSFDNFVFGEIKKDFILTKSTTAILIGINRMKINQDYYSFLKNEKGFSAKKINSFLLGTLSPPIETISSTITHKPQYTDYLNLKEASLYLGIHSELTSKLFSTDTLIKKEIFYKNNRPYLGVNRIALEKFNQKFVTVNRLAKDLKVLTQYLTEKLSCIGIKPAHGPFINDVKVNIFKRKDVRNLTTELINSINDFDKNFGYKTFIYRREKEELRNTALKLNISINEVKKLIKFNILVSYKHSRFHFFYISEESINYVDNILNSGDYINIIDIYPLLNCSPNWLKKYWINTNFLEIIDLRIGRYIQRETLTNIKILKEQYFTGVEASKYLGMPHQHITNLQSQGLIQAYYLGTENKVRLFLKKDVYSIKNQQGFDSLD